MVAIAQNMKEGDRQPNDDIPESFQEQLQMSLTEDQLLRKRSLILLNPSYTDSPRLYYLHYGSSTADKGDGWVKTSELFSRLDTETRREYSHLPASEGRPAECAGEKTAEQVME